MITEIACYAFVDYLEHNKTLDMKDLRVWKSEHQMN